MSVINGLTENAINVQTDIVSDLFWSVQQESFKESLWSPSTEGNYAKA